MRNKMITLCPTSYELAKQMPNFSAWVRMKVLEHMIDVHDQPQYEPKMPKNYMCKHCMAIEDHWSINCKVIQ